MATLDVGDRVLVTLVGSISGQTTMSTFCYGVSEAPVPIEQSVAMPLIRNALCATAGLVDKYVACTPSNHDITSIWLQVIAPTRYAKFALADTATGLNSEYTANTPNIAQVITRKGELATRKAISSLHVPCPTDFEWIEAGKLKSEALTALGALALEMQETLVTVGTVYELQPVINNGPGAGDLTPIKSIFTQDTVRVMRRRTVGLGI